MAGRHQPNGKLTVTSETAGSLQIVLRLRPWFRFSNVLGYGPRGGDGWTRAQTAALEGDGRVTASDGCTSLVAETEDCKDCRPRGRLGAEKGTSAQSGRSRAGLPSSGC